MNFPRFLLVFVSVIVTNLTIAQSISATDGLTNCAICAPPGWSIILGTPDVSDRFKAAATGTSGGGTDWVATPLPLPPNGHNNWLSLRDLGPSLTEEIVGTTMTGLISGHTYELTIYTLTAQAPYSPIFNDEFRYKVGTGPLQTVNPITQNTWGTETIVFTSTGTTETLELYPGNNSGGFGSFESVQISVTLNAIVDITDTDGDGVADIVDSDPIDPCIPVQSPGYTGFDPFNLIWATADCDNDGIINDIEFGSGSEPYDPCDPLITDADGDGICDVLEGINGTDPNDACDPYSDGDFDMDGICNKVDLDDDNDGVPDEMESPSCSMAELEVFNWLDFWVDTADPIIIPPSSPLNFGGVTLSLEREDPDAIFISGDIGALNLLNGIYKLKQSSVTGAKKTVSKFKFSQPVNQLEFAIIDIDSNATYQDNVLVNAYYGGSIYNITPSDFSLGPVVRYDGANKFIGSDVTGLYPEGEVILNFPGLVDSIIVEFSNSDPFPFATQTIGFRFGTAWCNTNDTDGDGVPDIFDLDSDNDGIYDVEESGNGSLATNGQITGAVGNNGLADAIETSVDSGTLITPPTDTDMNGVINAQQLDSDDDGCPDVTEAGFTDGDLDGILGSAPVSVDANGVVTSGTDGYTAPNLNYIDDMVASACPSPPDAVADNDAVDEDSIDNNIDLAGNDTDPDMDLDITSITIIGGPSSGGSVSVNPDGTIDYTPPMDFFGEDTIVYSICDMSSPTPLCDSDTVFITVNNIPDAPVAVVDVDMVNEDVIGAIVNLAGNDIDVDGDLDPASINIDSPPTSGGTATTNPDGTINYTPPPDFNGADTIVYSICDMTMPIPLCDSDTIFITVIPVPDGPDAVTDFDGAPENVMDVIIDLAGNDTDVDGDLDITSITIIGGPTSGGTAVPNPDGTITYNPPMGFNGADTIIYTICDMTMPVPLCDTDTVFITVDNIPDPVDAMTDNETVDEDSTNDIDILGNDVDPDFDIDPTSVIITAPTSGGMATVNPDGSVNYIPPPNYFGPDTILYTVCDMTMPVPFCDSDTLFITVLSIPDPPDAITDFDGTPEDVVDAIIDLAGNDTDVDGDLDIGSITIIGGPSSGGTAVPNPDGTITYNPPMGFNGVDTIIYTICDMTMPIPLCDSDTVFITVDSVPDPVDAMTDNETVDEDSTNDIDILGNDVDPDFDIDPTSVIITAPTSGGMATVNPDGSVNYTPPPNYFGPDTILYTVCDMTMPVPFCDSDTLFITVLSVPDPPDAITDFDGTPEDVVDAIIDLAGNDTDVDGDLDIGSITIIGGPSSGGTAVPNPDGTITYNPPMGFSGMDTIIYTICDMTMPIPLCDTDTVFIIVNSIPDPVDAMTDNETVDEDSMDNTLDILGNDIDPDFDIDPTSVVITSPTSGGMATVNPDGSVNYTPPPNYFGPDTILYTVCDLTMPIPFCDSDTLFIDVLSIPDPPVANTDFAGAPENFVDAVINIAGNDTDVDGDLDIGSITIIGGPSSGGTAVPNPDGTITYNPPMSFIGVDTIIYTICDMTMPIPLCDTDTVFIDVDNIPDPVDAITDSVTVDEDSTTDINVIGNDIDPDFDIDPTSVAITSPTSGGTATVNPDGSINYTPPPNYFGPDTIIYVVCDMTMPIPFCDSDTLFITVLSVPDPPDANTDITGTSENAVDVIIDAGGNDTDVDGDLDLGSITIIGGPSSGGTAVANPDGTITYNPPLNFIGVDTIIYTICDMTIPIPLCDTDTIFITVDNVPDAPVAVTDSTTTDEDTPLSDIDLSGNDFDIDGDLDPSSVSIILGPTSGGSISLNGDGSIDYFPPMDFYGVDTIIYIICDMTFPVPLCDTDTLFITVNPINDPPVAVDDGGVVFGQTPINIDVLDDDFDVDNDSIFITSAVSSVGGIVVFNPDGTIDYTAPADFCGTDTITYVICDDGIPSLCDTAIVLIEVMLVDTDGDGIPDAVETLTADTDGDGNPDYLELDSDDDSIPDEFEAMIDDTDPCNPTDPVDSDGDGMFDFQDEDSDADGIPDSIEAGPDGNNPVDTDGDGLWDYLDLDSDNDMIPDEVEAGSDPNNPVDTDGNGDPDYTDLDSDDDGIPDEVEAGSDPNNPVDTDGNGDPDYTDLDSDDDGIPDSVEAGPDGNNPVDTDGDGDPDYQDLDSDDDGIPDSVEAGSDPNNPVDTDGNGDPDYTDLDSDDDGIPDEVEAGDDPNNPVDTDGNGDPDYTDLDSDDDGIPDEVEAGDDPNNPVDTDLDGDPDYQDLDSDNDTIPDSVEAGSDGDNPVDTDGNGDPDYTDLDSDGDGIPDEVEAGDDPNNPVDTDLDGDPDYQDIDSDGDGIPDDIEAGDDGDNPVDTDGDGDPDYQDLDSDADSILDGLADDEEALDDCDDDGIYDFRDPDPCDLTIPLGFSPGNGDMVNEFWEIQGLSAFPDNTLRIFNRWGQEVFYAAPYNNDWNGDSSEGTLPTGTYYYILELTSEITPNQAGWVYLNRE